jgi:hypothetical protein
LSRMSPWSRRRTRAISSIERPPKTKLPNWVSSASDHSLLVSAAGSWSSTAVPCGSMIEAPMTRSRASCSGCGGPLRKAPISHPLPGGGPKSLTISRR